MVDSSQAPEQLPTTRGVTDEHGRLFVVSALVPAILGLAFPEPAVNSCAAQPAPRGSLTDEHGGVLFLSAALPRRPGPLYAEPSVNSRAARLAP